MPSSALHMLQLSAPATIACQNTWLPDTLTQLGSHLAGSRQTPARQTQAGIGLSAPTHRGRHVQNRSANGRLHCLVVCAIIRRYGGQLIPWVGVSRGALLSSPSLVHVPHHKCPAPSPAPGGRGGAPPAKRVPATRNEARDSLLQPLFTRQHTSHSA